MKRLTTSPASKEAGNLYAQIKPEFRKDYFPGAEAADPTGFGFSLEEAALAPQCGFTFPVINVGGAPAVGIGRVLLNTWDAPQWFVTADLEFFLLSDQEAEVFAAATEAGLFADLPNESLETILDKQANDTALMEEPPTAEPPTKFALDHTKSFELANAAFHAITAGLILLGQAAGCHPDSNVRKNLALAESKLAEDLEELHLMVGDDEA